MVCKVWRAGPAVLLALVLSGCGGGGGGSTTPTTPTSPASVAEAIASAAAVAANDTAGNKDPTSDNTNKVSPAFAVLQAAGVPVVSINSPPVVNFTVISDGKVLQGLTNANVRLAIAKLVPGTDGNPDQWVSYVYRKETAAAGVGPGGTPALATAMQATTDPNTPAQLVFNPDGYYTYTFSTDIKDTAKTNGVVYEPGRTHRVAIQLSYKNAAGETVLVNPYFDFTVGADGLAVPVTDASKTRKMTDVGSCNGCHEKLALHGGGRVDTQYCVMCHNPGTTDANSGNVLTLATMVHKIHSGKLLKASLTAGKGGEDYTIWGFNNTQADYAEVGFPQDLRNCTKCHSASTATPQGDNWKTAVSKEACLTCHANKPGSDWEASHRTFAGTLVGAGAAATDLSNAQCKECHKVGSNIAPERVHWNQNEENAAKYKMNIESATWDANARKVTVKYFLSDPTTADNAAYNLVTPDCTAAAPAVCNVLAADGRTVVSRFGNLRFYVAYQNLVGQNTTVTEFSSYNNGGSGVSAFAYRGTNDGSNHYTVDIPLPADSATAVAAGTARVVSIGQVKEPQLQVKWATDPRPEVVPRVLVNTVVQNSFKDFAITGPLTPRRTVVSSAKCNVCHGALGTTSGSNTLANAFHGGARDTVEACVLCHDANRASNGNTMTNGLNLYESYQFKRMIHGIHGNSKRTTPFTHGNTVAGLFNKDGTSATGGAPLASNVENYAAEVAWPGVGINCNACHENNSYKQDFGQLGAVVFKDTGVTDPLLWKVITPKAASCTACHDRPGAIAHVTSFGGAAFGDKTQAQINGLPRETCDDCHSPGGFKGVDLVHGQK